MPIADLCPKQFVCIEQGASLQTATLMMKDQFLSSLVVVSSSDFRKPLGVLTERDVLMAVVAENIPRHAPVDSVMSKNVMTAQKDERIAAVFERLESQKVRRVVIVDLDGRACGLVSLDDLLPIFGRKLQSLGQLVEQQIENDRIARAQQIQFLL